MQKWPECAWRSPASQGAWRLHPEPLHNGHAASRVSVTGPRLASGKAGRKSRGFSWRSVGKRRDPLWQRASVAAGEGGSWGPAAPSAWPALVLCWEDLPAPRVRSKTISKQLCSSLAEKPGPWEAVRERRVFCVQTQAPGWHHLSLLHPFPSSSRCGNIRLQAEFCRLGTQPWSLY